MSQIWSLASLHRHAIHARMFMLARDIRQNHYCTCTSVTGYTHALTLTDMTCTSLALCALGMVSFSAGGSALAGRADCGMKPVRECARR